MIAYFVLFTAFAITVGWFGNHLRATSGRPLWSLSPA